MLRVCQGLRRVTCVLGVGAARGWGVLRVLGEVAGGVERDGEEVRRVCQRRALPDSCGVEHGDDDVEGCLGFGV